MGSVNKVIIVGNLGKDPELRTTSGGQSIAEFSVATSESWTGKDGQRNERTEWHRVIVWGRQGESCAQYLSKGRPVYIEGKIQTREWTDRDGNKRYMTEIVATNVVFLGGGDGQRRQAPPKIEEPSGGGFTAEEIPF